MTRTFNQRYITLTECYNISNFDKSKVSKSKLKQFFYLILISCLNQTSLSSLTGLAANNPNLKFKQYITMFYVLVKQKHKTSKCTWLRFWFYSIGE